MGFKKPKDIIGYLAMNLKHFCSFTINCLQQHYFGALKTLRMRSTNSLMYVCNVCMIKFR